MTEIKQNQRLELVNRRKLTIDRVTNVNHFTEKEILLKTATGALKILGSELKIEDLSKEKGEILITGMVDSVIFSEIREKHGFFKDILK